MPAPGDQHKPWANPFEEPKPQISEWTAKDIASISAKLDKQLGPEYISSRAGPGGNRVHYLSAEKVISLANEVFGFNGWSSSIQNIQVDFADENPQTQRVCIGLSVIVRVTLRDGTYHEDVGYGSVENAKGKAMAFEKAKKEGTTDGLKRALRSFGNILGNCIYDKEYVKHVTKVKAQPVKFDQDSLHRHADYTRKDVPASGPSKPSGGPTPAPAPALKANPSESFEDFLGELDEADFCVPEDGHPDEITLPNPAPAAPAPHGTKTQPSAQPSRNFPGGQPPQTPGGANGIHRDVTTGQSMGAPPMPAHQVAPVEQATFFSARSVGRNLESKEAGLSSSQVFNPKAESPSIRKTPGIDHSSSRPVTRTGQHVPPAASQSSAAVSPGTSGFAPPRQTAGSNGPVTRSNMVNPSLDHARRIGAPGAGGSPLANRSSYKPPTMKRSLGGEVNGSGAQRDPLSDLPANTNAANNTVAAIAGDGIDTKRQKTA